MSDANRRAPKPRSVERRKTHTDIHSQLLSDHYNAVRADIIEKNRARDRTVELWITLVAATYAFASLNQDGTWVLLFVPFLTMVAAIMHGFHDLMIAAQSHWLASRYQNAVTQALGVETTQWDANIIRDQRIIVALGFRYVALALLFFIASWGTFCIRYYFLPADYIATNFFGIEVFYFIVSSIVSVGATVYVVFLRMRFVEKQL